MFQLLEAEYTYKLCKTIIPSRLEYKYNPDGWLGIMIGTKLWFDFSVDEKFETSVQGLVKEIHTNGNEGKFPILPILLSNTYKALLFINFCTINFVLLLLPQIEMQFFVRVSVFSVVKQKVEPISHYPPSTEVHAHIRSTSECTSWTKDPS